MLNLTSNHPRKQHYSNAEGLTVLSNAAYDAHLVQFIAPLVLKRLLDCRKLNWKHGYKALSMVEHVMLRGSVQVIWEMCQSPLGRHLESMSGYYHTNDDVLMRVLGVAKRIASFVSDPNHIGATLKFNVLASSSSFSVHAEAAELALPRSSEQRDSFSESFAKHQAKQGQSSDAFGENASSDHRDSFSMVSTSPHVYVCGCDLSLCDT
jgi:hypothetical protein